MDEAASKLKVPQPCRLVEGKQGDAITTAHLGVERQMVTLLPATKGLLALLSSFYAFNMHYTEGCINFYTALEMIILKKRDLKRIKLIK